MGTITIKRGDQYLGQFATNEEVREGLRSGRFLPADMWQRDGTDEWKPLRACAKKTYRK